jgi:heavy metal translocating P-type ATPase
VTSPGTLSSMPQRLLTLGALGGLAAGAGLWALGEARAADLCWAATTALVLAPSTWSVLRALGRRETGVDLIAILAMTGSLLLGEYLAGAIIAVMLRGGEALEDYAARRARRELAGLLERVPSQTHRREGDRIVTVPIEEVKRGDLLLIKPGEVLPTDGVLVSELAILDQSALTGESKPVEHHAGALLSSGASNTGAPFELRATATAATSTYAGIVRLVSAAESSKAPFVRLADRYATWFLGLTALLALGAWALSGQVERALAVLVVATPCPLIIAAPAAIIAGVSRAARYGVIVKGGGPLEALARMSQLLLDKTGTVTTAVPEVTSVERLGSLATDELLRLAASAEQVSVHPFAPVIVREAHSRNLTLSFPERAREEPGSGVEGTVEGRTVRLGQLEWVATSPDRPGALRSIATRTAVEGSSSVFVSVDGALEGAIILQDQIRPEAPRTLRELRKLGVAHIHMVTGDHPDVAELIGDAVGVDRVFAERTPAEKVEVLELVRREGTTAMVGDGMNDAPALALADVGIAMGARGAAAAAEAADVVLTGDRLDGLLNAVRIARRTRRIALESVVAGMALSLVAMGAAALGYLEPVYGAVLQELIDVAVILNALRALGGRDLASRGGASAQKLARELEAEHHELSQLIAELPALAARLDALEPAAAREELRRVANLLTGKLIPHEREEQETAYPLIARMMKDEDPTGPLIQTHHEIQRLTRLYGRLVDRLPSAGPGPEDLRDLRRALYGLHAILVLHFAQEEEVYSVLDE